MLYRDLMLAATAAGNTIEVRVITQRLRQVFDVDPGANDADDLLDPTTTQLYANLTRKGAGGPGAAENTPGALRHVND